MPHTLAPISLPHAVSAPHWSPCRVRVLPPMQSPLARLSPQSRGEKVGSRPGSKKRPNPNSSLPSWELWTSYLNFLGLSFLLCKKGRLSMLTFSCSEFERR